MLLIDSRMENTQIVCNVYDEEWPLKRDTVELTFAPPGYTFRSTRTFLFLDPPH